MQKIKNISRDNTTKRSVPAKPQQVKVRPQSERNVVVSLRRERVWKKHKHSNNNCTGTCSCSCSYVSKDVIDSVIGQNKSEDVIHNYIKTAFQQSKYFNNFPESALTRMCTLFEGVYLDSDYVAFPIGYAKSKKVVIVVDGNLMHDKTNEVLHSANAILFEDAIYNNSKEQIDYSLLPYPDVLLLEADLMSVLRLYNVKSLAEVIMQYEITATLSKVSLFKTFPEKKLQQLAIITNTQRFAANQVVIKEGDKGDCFYIVKSGAIKITVKGVYIRTLQQQEYFGERALLMNELRTATAVAQGETWLYCISKKNFLGNIETNMRNFLMQRLALQDDSVALEDFEFVKELGVGNYGSVSLVTSVKSKNKYAIKAISLKHILYEKLHRNLSLEKAILLQVDHPFIVKLVKCLKDKHNVYFLMEYLKGKELFEVIRDIGLLSKPQAQFYAASIMIAIHYLHKRRFIYRDIKPENIIISQNGYIKLVDFGTAKEIQQDTTNTIIGTPHYMAPEVILGENYSFGVDYWSIAVCLFEFICGGVPFGETSEDPMEIYLSIINNSISFPLHCKDKEFKSLMKGMLNKVPGKRVSELNDVKESGWFKGFQWEELMAMNMEAPYFPEEKVSGSTDNKSEAHMNYKTYIMNQTSKLDGKIEMNGSVTGKQKEMIEKWYNSFC